MARRFGGWRSACARCSRLRAMTLPPLSLYLHLPWCVRKCPYCDFNSHTLGAEDQTDRYVQALCSDLQLEAAAGRAAGRTIDTVFFGGGTPSLFSPGQIAALLEAIGALLTVSPRAEITMEANPGTIEHGRLADYSLAGINRLSLGAQSFDPDMLERLGRIHAPGDIIAACDEASQAGFAAINLDLMFALPGQDLSLAAADLEQALACQPAHISYYQLTLEPNTVFHSRPPDDLPDDDAAWQMQEQGHAMLAAAGFSQYEVSAFASGGQQCRHNLNYWQFGDYLAIGAGAHGKFTATDGSIWRYRKPAHPAAYMQQSQAGSFKEEPERVAPAALCFEYMLNALRLPAGFVEQDFVARTGLPFSVLEQPLRRAETAGMIEATAAARWRPTALGLRFLNDLQAQFLPH